MYASAFLIEHLCAYVAIKSNSCTQTRLRMSKVARRHIRVMSLEWTWH